MLTHFLNALKGELSFQVTEENLQIRSDQIRARLRLYPVMVISQMFVEPLFVWLFWKHADHTHLLWWLTGIYTLHLVDMLFWWRYHEQIRTIPDCKNWRRLFDLFTLLTALMWGVMEWWFFPQDLAFQVLMICLVLGLVAGAVTLDSVYPPSLYIYVSGVSFPLLARLVMVGNETHFILASMLLLFMIGSFSAGRELSKTFWKSLWQRYENDLLIQQLTEQKAIAETANRDKSKFLASASHDLRQPLQALVLFSEALQETTNTKDSNHIAMQIGKSVGALVDMFDELLDISKFDAGVVQVTKLHFKLQEVFDRLQADFAPLALAKGLELHMPKSVFIAYSDPHLLERILRNLISNAIRYTDFGKVQVNCIPVDEILHFEIIDTGIGIRPESLPHIFEEYYQVDNQHRDRLKGLGLGLAIVRRMETLLDCKVMVASRPALGSVFSFSIPQGSAAQLNQPPSASHSHYDLREINVAVIEDNPDIRQMTTKLLKQWGCHVYDGELPHAVFNHMEIANIRPDILICDYRLPHKLTAIDVISMLRKMWGNDISVLVLTGDTAPQTLHNIKRSGAFLLHKPISPARLRSIMHFALNNKTGTTET